jgi:hypothetical protein
VKADTVFIFDPRVHMQLSVNEKENLDKLELYKEYDWFSEVSKLKSGDHFGDLAILDNKPRAATIKCINNCHFATLGHDDYQRVLAK